MFNFDSFHDVFNNKVDYSDLWSMSLKLPFVVKTVINKFWYIYNPNISGHMELNFKNFNVDVRCLLSFDTRKKSNIFL